MVVQGRHLRMVVFYSVVEQISNEQVLSNGQLLIGDNSGDPTVGTLTGTTNQVTVTNGRVV